jgi:hypothetical protein
MKIEWKLEIGPSGHLSNFLCDFCDLWVFENPNDQV